MFNSELEAKFLATFKLARLIYWALGGAVLTYIFVVEITKFVMKSSAGIGTAGLPEFLPYLFYFLGIIMIVPALLTRKFFFAPKRAQVVADADEQIKILQSLINGTIILGVLAETPAVMGLALFFLTGNSADFYIMFVITVFLYAYLYPRVESFRAAVGWTPGVPS